MFLSMERSSQTAFKSSALPSSSCELSSAESVGSFFTSGASFQETCLLSFFVFLLLFPVSCLTAGTFSDFISADCSSKTSLHSSLLINGFKLSSVNSGSSSLS